MAQVVGLAPAEVVSARSAPMEAALPVPLATGEAAHINKGAGAGAEVALFNCATRCVCVCDIC